MCVYVCTNGVCVCTHVCVCLQVRLPTKSDRPANRDSEGPVIKKSVSQPNKLILCRFLHVQLYMHMYIYMYMYVQYMYAYSYILSLCMLYFILILSLCFHCSHHSPSSLRTCMFLLKAPSEPMHCCRCFLSLQSSIVVIPSVHDLNLHQ